MLPSTSASVGVKLNDVTANDSTWFSTICRSSSGFEIESYIHMCQETKLPSVHVLVIELIYLLQKTICYCLQLLCQNTPSTCWHIISLCKEYEQYDSVMKSRGLGSIAVGCPLQCIQALG